MATIEEIRKSKREWFDKYIPYKMTYYTEFNYNSLVNIMWKHKTGRGDNATYNDVIIMLDTETSKKKGSEENHIVAWTISLRAYNRNIVTLWGTRPRECVHAIQLLMENMKGYETYIYVHNLPYDFTFLELFLFEQFGIPSSQLNIKTHYPINIKWECGLILRDSLILAQRSLEKWAKDLDVEHKKASGKWDYNKLRNQSEVNLSDDELEYIEHDTLAGVECIDKLMQSLGKSVFSMPLTATGIPREEVYKRGSENRARDTFKRNHLSYEQYLKCLQVYHGGYTHGNRHHINELINKEVKGLDFTSSYPFVMLSEKYPSDPFEYLGDVELETILEGSEKYAFMFKLLLDKPRLKNDVIPMPYLQMSKSTFSLNVVVDNGRVLCAEMFEIITNEIDLQIILDQYDFDHIWIKDCEYSEKAYLPRWFTDYIFELYEQKTYLKDSDDKVAYALSKAKLNSLYGLCCQRSIRDIIEEDYKTGEYNIIRNINEEEYDKYVKKPKNVLLYQTGTWVTSYAAYNLFQLGKCVDYKNGGEWLYSDTDSCYATKWDEKKVDAYNRNCLKKLKANGYDSVIYKGKTYTLGIAVSDEDSIYTEFKYMGAKRYCGRAKYDNELHITVAGVPKKTGMQCLHDNINNFRPGLVFDGKTTGKLLHKYILVDKIYIDSNGNETGHSINLEPCDYLLDAVEVVNWEEIFENEIEIGGYYEGMDEANKGIQ